MQLDILLANEEEQLALGARLSQVFTQGLVFLTGNLGAGKTTLTRGWVQALGHAGAVKSPTYTLIEEYTHLAPKVYHLDLYRLADPEELELLGFRDFLAPENLLIIEWPEKGAGFLPAADLTLELEVTASGRKAKLTAFSTLAKQALAELAKPAP